MRKSPVALVDEYGGFVEPGRYNGSQKRPRLESNQRHPVSPRITARAVSPYLVDQMWTNVDAKRAGSNTGCSGAGWAPVWVRSPGHVVYATDARAVVTGSRGVPRPC